MYRKWEMFYPENVQEVENVLKWGHKEPLMSGARKPRQMQTLLAGVVYIGRSVKGGGDL